MTSVGCHQIIRHLRQSEPASNRVLVLIIWRWDFYGANVEESELQMEFYFGVFGCWELLSWRSVGSDWRIKQSFPFFSILGLKWIIVSKAIVEHCWCHSIDSVALFFIIAKNLTAVVQSMSSMTLPWFLRSSIGMVLLIVHVGIDNNNWIFANCPMSTNEVFVWWNCYKYQRWFHECYNFYWNRQFPNILAK